MPSRNKRHRRSFIAKVTELGFAVPQVVAHRMTRLALAGVSPSARDRREFRQMGNEKTVAFAESLNAMAVQAFRANYELTASFWRSYWRSWLSSNPSPFTGSDWHNAAYGVLNKGIGPVHRRAVANAKRLARTRLR
jgi:hypothetical protein